MGESISPNNLLQNNSQAYEANLNVQDPLNVKLNDEKNVQNQINKNQNLGSNDTNSINNEYYVQKNQIIEQKNENTIEKGENELYNSHTNTVEINDNNNYEKSKSEPNLNQMQLSESSENIDNSQNLQDQSQSQIDDSNLQDEQNYSSQRSLNIGEEHIHPINTPIEEIYGVDQNSKEKLIFTVRFAGYNKIERVTNQDMRKYHQQELIAFYEKCMTFGQQIDMPPYKPR